jgi:hypothetical protein
MKTRIQAFPLVPGVLDLELPEGSQVLHVAEYIGKAAIWIMLNLGTEATVKRSFRSIASGSDIVADPDRYIGTVVGVLNMTTVLHVFEVTDMGPEHW